MEKVTGRSGNTVISGNMQDTAVQLRHRSKSHRKDVFGQVDEDWSEITLQKPPQDRARKGMHNNDNETTRSQKGSRLLPYDQVSYHLPFITRHFPEKGVQSSTSSQRSGSFSLLPRCSSILSWEMG